MKILTWNQFQAARLECECGWHGHGHESVTGESTDQGVHKHCPACGEHFGVVASPMALESVSDSRAAATERKFANIVLYGARKLH